MLLKATTSKILSQNSINFRAYYNHFPHQTWQTFRNSYNFIPGYNQDSQIINKYLNNPQRNLKTYTESSHNFQKITVPRFQPNAEQIQHRLQNEWKNKKLILNIDPSALMGFKRLLVKTHLQKNVYQGVSNPNTMLSEQNPSFQYDIEQLKFDDDYFLSTDPVAQEIMQKTEGLDDEKSQQILHEALADIYEKDPQRFSKRLKNQYKVPVQYHKLIELGMYNQNPIYFCGINQYAFRNLLSKCLNLSELRQMFMLSLKFAQSESYKLKINQNLQLTGRLEDIYSKLAREHIYFNTYKTIKKIENGQIWKRIKFLAHIKQEDKQDQQKVSKPGRRGFSSKSKGKNTILFAHQYTIETLDDHVLISNLQSYFSSQQPKLSPNSTNSPAVVGNTFEPDFKQTDAQKIQKHAILQVMLGNLWSQPYTLNKFPYLSQNYLKLNENDKEYVQKIYYQNIAKYTTAKRVFYEKHINTLQKLSQTDLKDIRVREKYKSAEEQYEKFKEAMKNRLEEREKRKQMKQNVDKISIQETAYSQYQQKYQETQEDNPVTQQIKKMMEQQLEQQGRVNDKKLNKEMRKRGRSTGRKASLQENTKSEQKI